MASGDVGRRGSWMSGGDEVDLRERLVQAADQKRDRLVQVVSEAVRIPSVVGEEGAIARWLEDRARDIPGVEIVVSEPSLTQLQEHRAFVPVDAGYEGRPNVGAILRGTGGGRSLILYGHVDVVPVDPNTTWEHDPWGGDVADGRVYGRGSADMKGGCGVALVALEVLAELAVRLRGDVAAHFIVEEEGGGNGTLAAVLDGWYGPRTGCIMLEPTSPRLMLITGRGAQFFRLVVPGQEGGVEYQHELVNAIDKAYVLHDAVRRYWAMRESRVSHPLYEIYGRTKVPTAVCQIQAGAWPSTVPGEAVLEGTIECLPGEDIRQVVAEFEDYLREVAKSDPWLVDHPFRFETFGLWFEAAELPRDHEFVTTVETAAKQATGEAPQVIGGGGSDLRLPVLYADCPTVLFGPGGGPIHSVDEWVEIDQLVDVLKAVLLAAVDWCGAAQ